MEKGWLRDNIENIMLGMEIFMVAGVAAVFVVYFVVKRQIKAKKNL